MVAVLDNFTILQAKHDGNLVNISARSCVFPSQYLAYG